MLKQRIFTALVLLACLLPALWMQNPGPLAVIMGLLMLAGSWEWSRLNELKVPSQWLAPVIFHLLMALSFSLFEWHELPNRWVILALACVALVWVISIPWMLIRGMSDWVKIPQFIRLVVGWLMIAACALSVLAAHQKGLNFLLSILCLVWLADISAYFGGRLWGRRKLAPSISPGKSWAGVYTAAVGVLIMSGLWVWADDFFDHASLSLYSILWRESPLLWLLGTLFLLGFSVCGDLVESLVKRVSGYKDSSQLLPGHGGVLDRIDALLPVLPFSMLMDWVLMT